MPLTYDPESRVKLRRGMRYYMIGSAIVLALAICYVGWAFFSRWQHDRAVAEKAAAAKRTQDQQTFQAMGGNSFEILAFYANPTAISRGDSASLCYSVSNAKSITLEPPSGVNVWPSYERCVNVSPSKTTAYTLTAADAAAHTKFAQATIEVH
ncbi:MAG TPA: hypothetical protein VGR97_10280 [Candidatus Acidoferrales bacterium]|nr:hypothetical protein [Candidatus Acidoferrales bacterium]